MKAPIWVSLYLNGDDPSHSSSGIPYHLNFDQLLTWCSPPNPSLHSPASLESLLTEAAVKLHVPPNHHLAQIFSIQGDTVRSLGDICPDDELVFATANESFIPRVAATIITANGAVQVLSPSGAATTTATGSGQGSNEQETDFHYMHTAAQYLSSWATWGYANTTHAVRQYASQSVVDSLNGLESKASSLARPMATSAVPLVTQGITWSDEAVTHLVRTAQQSAQSFLTSPAGQQLSGAVQDSLQSLPQLVASAYYYAIASHPHPATQQEDDTSSHYRFFTPPPTSTLQTSIPTGRSTPSQSPYHGPIIDSDSFEPLSLPRSAVQHPRHTTTAAAPSPTLSASGYPAGHNRRSGQSISPPPSFSLQKSQQSQQKVFPVTSAAVPAAATATPSSHRQVTSASAVYPPHIRSQSLTKSAIGFSQQAAAQQHLPQTRIGRAASSSAHHDAYLKKIRSELDPEVSMDTVMPYIERAYEDMERQCHPTTASDNIPNITVHSKQNEMTQKNAKQNQVAAVANQVVEDSTTAPSVTPDSSDIDQSLSSPPHQQLPSTPGQQEQSPSPHHAAPEQPRLLLKSPPIAAPSAYGLSCSKVQNTIVSDDSEAAPSSVEQSASTEGTPSPDPSLERDDKSSSNIPVSTSPVPSTPEHHLADDEDQSSSQLSSPFLKRSTTTTTASG